MSGTNSSQPAIWLVLGKTRAGKGEFIKTIIKKHTGDTLDIVSDSLKSHTKKSNSYTFQLSSRKMKLVDTVGFDDTEGDNLAPMPS